MLSCMRLELEPVRSEEWSLEERSTRNISDKHFTNQQ
jgi:hypothetical protein